MEVSLIKNNCRVTAFVERIVLIIVFTMLRHYPTTLFTSSNACNVRSQVILKNRTMKSTGISVRWVQMSLAACEIHELSSVRFEPNQ